MKNPNGFGCVAKLGGNRRKPFVALVTSGYEYGGNIKKIEFLKDIISPETFKKVQEEYNAYYATRPKAKQKQTPIGYFETRKDALIALAEYNKQPYDLDRNKVRFCDIYERIKPDFLNLSKSSIKTYTNAYNHCEKIAKMKITQITTQTMQTVIDESPTCQGGIITLCHKVFEYALINDLVTKDYSQYLKETFKREKVEKQPFTAEEIKLLWENIDWITPPDSRRLSQTKLVDTLLILTYTGLRIGELLALKSEDVNIEERIISVHGTKTKNAERKVPIHKDIIPLLKARLDKENEYLIPSKTGKQLRYDAYHADFYTLFREQFQLKHGIHDTRHTFVSCAQACELNQILLKKIVGHTASNDVTFSTYTHTYKKSLVDEIDKLIIC